MRYLLYCIFHTPENQRPETLLGVENQPVVIISNNGLCAAASGLAQSELPLETSQIITYKKVIDAFHQDRTVIPMRYGCLVKGMQHVSRLLEGRSNEYGLLLKDLQGCVEMGIRVMIADCGLRIADFKKKSEQYPIPGTQYSSSGKNYLTARKAYYAQEEKLTQKFENIVADYRRVFSGHYVRFKSECSAAEIFHSSISIPQSAIRNPILSLYFLVPRDSVTSFKQVFWHLSCGESAKILLSGPWPPYNFVMADHFSKQETSCLQPKNKNRMTGKE